MSDPEFKKKIRSLISKRVPVFKVPLLGTGGAGKTALRLRICQDSFVPDLHMTIGIDMETKILNYKGLMAIQLWDYGGQPHFEDVRRLFYSDFHGTDASLVIVDTTTSSSLEFLENWYDIAKELTPKENIIIVGTKIDLRKEIGDNESLVVTKKVGEKAAKEKGVIYIETSAKTGTGIQELEDTLGKILSKKIEK